MENVFQIKSQEFGILLCHQRGMWLEQVFGYAISHSTNLVSFYITHKLLHFKYIYIWNLNTLRAGVRCMNTSISA